MTEGFSPNADMNVLDIHANAHSTPAQARYPASIEARRPFQSPGLICVVEMGLLIIGNGLPIAVDHNRRVVVLWASRPLIGDVHLLGISSDDIALVLQSGGARPQGG